jgi:hypothetical protein
MLTSTKTVANLLTEVDRQMVNIYTDEDKVGWINEVEQQVYELLNEYSVDTITTSSANNSLTGKVYDFEDIRKVLVGGVEYSVSTLNYNDVYSYYKNGTNLSINPAPTGSVTMVVIYKEKPTVKTVANKSTDKLNIPLSFDKLYKYYIFSQMCNRDEDFNKGADWLNQYNAVVQDFLSWYASITPKFGA